MSKLNLTATVSFEDAEDRVLTVTLDDVMVSLMKSTPSLWSAFIATVSEKTFTVLNTPDPEPRVEEPVESVVEVPTPVVEL